MPRARGEIREALLWWRENRTKAPNALAEELMSTIRFIRENPGAGLKVHGAPEGFHYTQLKRVRYLLYYQDAGVVRVLSLWHASRRPPKP